MLDGSFGYWQLIFGYIMLLIVLGMLLDAASTMLLVVPLMLPVIVNLGIDPIWFGVVTVIAVEIGLLTPPFGLAIFVVKNAVRGDDVGLRALYIGTFPFVVMTSIVLGLVVCFPALATALL